MQGDLPPLTTGGEGSSFVPTGTGSDEAAVALTSDRYVETEEFTSLIEARKTRQEELNHLSSPGTLSIRLRAPPTSLKAARL